MLDREEAIRLFDIHDVGRAPSRMDYAKLTHLNGIYLRQADDDRLTGEVVARLARRPICRWCGGGGAHPGADAGAQGSGADAGGARGQFGVPRCGRAVPFEPKAAALLTRRERADAARTRGGAGGNRFFRTGAGRGVARLRRRTGRKLGQVAQPLRAALTGSTASPGIDATLVALGREEVLRRIEAAAG